jgi:Zn-dependent protease with chaperone function
MDDVYPIGPTSVPENLTTPTANYRRQAWLATGGLLLFVAGYFALAGWFAWTAYRLWAGVANAAADSVIGDLIGGTAAAFLAVFMFKALVFVKRGQAVEDLEITSAEQPALFAFLYRLADEAGAPRPHRVFLSGRVNAGVFYDLSLANLLIPSRKNLEIGLGLVNVLNLGELKAVLAHELGHFAQRSMALGRWVYIAQQIAAHIVARRDAFDTFLARFSRIDPRIAWIAWVLRIIVWSIRSLVDLVFRIVVLAERALAREMEFQADLVAVSLTGSDALIHALHRLGAADQSWSRAVDFANNEIREGRGVQDLFAIQARIMERVRFILSDPDYGLVPPVPAPNPAIHRLFKETLATPPKMWATHPSNSDRENNAKRTYVPASIDERSAWTLFKDPDALRARVTSHLARSAQCKAVPLEETLARVDEQYARAYLEPSYRGAYLGRSIVRHAKSVDELFGQPAAQTGLMTMLDSLYPESLSAKLQQLRELTEEKTLLTALRTGLLTAPGGVIRRRGETISRKALPHVVDSVQRELDSCEQSIRDHDKRCRTAHLTAAAALGEGWTNYLKGLLQLLHYADHVEANLLDAHALLANTVSVVTASGRISSSGRGRVLHAAETTYSALRDVHEAVDKVVPDRTVLHRLKTESWRSCVEQLQLPAPTVSNLGEWLNAIDSWTRSTANSLSKLRLAALEQLLAVEAQVARWTRVGLKPADAPPPSQVPREYRLLLPGTERPKNTLDWWERFQAGSGFLPTAVRVLAAAAIIGSVFLIANHFGQSTVYIFNGLGQQVRVQLGGRNVDIPAFGHTNVEGDLTDPLHIVTATSDGRRIEEFDVKPAGSSSHEVYNVAGAGVLVAWEAAYGSAQPQPPTLVGNTRWSQTSAQVIFEQPPRSVPTKYGAATRRVLTGLGGESPNEVLAAARDPATAEAVMAAHVRWDSSNARFTDLWVSAAMATPRGNELLKARIQDQPTDIYNMRVEQWIAGSSGRATVCAKHRQLAQGAPDNPDLQYIAARCIDDPEKRDQAFLDLQSRWPKNGWLAFASAYVLAQRDQWPEALAMSDTASARLPGMREEVTLLSARMTRMIDGPSASNLRALADRSLLVRMTGIADLPPESGQLHGIARAYVMLANGNLTQALEAKAGSPEEQARLLRLVAASDGARPEDISRALALSPDMGLDSATVLPTLALLSRKGGATAPYMQRAAKLFGADATPMLNAFALLRNHASEAEIKRALRDVPVESQALVYVAAAVLRGSECPPQWRLAAQRLLFGTERPYLR